MTDTATLVADDPDLTPEALFDAPRPPAVHWHADEMELVNWGGFDGARRVRFDVGSTLLSGASGTGKSTLLDAYTALMMPSDVPFNGASNDAVGRARGTEQRSLVSYLRGQTDITLDTEGTQRAQVMRGDERATWGGVAMTFVSDDGQAFTVARLYYVPATARMNGDVTARLLTFDGRLALTDFEPLAGEQFQPAKLKAARPGVAVFDTYQAFAARLFTRLGIGANADGDKALRLLARVQAGHQIRTVDDLYKQMVLEEPATFAAADQALAHFDHLADTYRRMLDEHHKERILEPIPEAWDRLCVARATITQIDTFGVAAAPGTPTPLGLWSLRRQGETIEGAITANRQACEPLKTTLAKAHEQMTTVLDELAATKQEYDDAGGADVEALERRAGDAEALAQSRQAALERLVAQVTPVIPEGADLSQEETFTQLAASGERFLGDYAALRRPLLDHTEDLQGKAWRVHQDLAEVRADLTSLAGRQTRIPRSMEELREQVCAATGMGVGDLPYLAELVDVRPEEDRWRTAVETVLAASARLLLVPADRFEDFSAAIDPLPLRGLIRFSAADLGRPEPAPAPQDTVAGKLAFRDSPFRGWVAAHLSDPGRNATCVPDSSGLAGPGLRVTAAGQTRRGRQGTHGRGDQRNILGFTNADLVAELQARRDELESTLAEMDRQREVARAKLADLEERYGAFKVLSGAEFTQVDVSTPTATAAELREAIARLHSGNDRLAELEELYTKLNERAEELNKRIVLTQHAIEQLDDAWGALVEDKDRVVDELTAVEDTQSVMLTDEQSADLDAHFEAACDGDDPGDLDRWWQHLAALRKRLEAAQQSARTEAERALKELERAFEMYREQFQDPNLGATVDSYPDYATILEEVRAVGLATRRTEWRRALMHWSGEDLVPLARAMSTAVSEIEDRLGPVNDILANLTFGSGDDRLGMRLRRLNRDQVAKFRRQLADLSSGATIDLPDNLMEARFRELEAFMAQLRPAGDPRHDAKVANRVELLDVRRQVEIRAERYPKGHPDVVQATYTSLGSKSGGETQELIAFIVGAALRYRLGDEHRPRPRFAPVFLDEGFIKADAEFASRAVGAWKALGFQLIVAAPMDKVAALEPHMDAFLMVTKDARTKRSRVVPFSDADRVAVRRTGTLR